MSENDVLGDSTNPDPASAPVRLHRSSTNRKVAGVAGGIGERFDIDANVVRVVFIVLTLAAGLGAAIYLAMWACVPQSGAQEGDEVANTSDGGHHWRFRSLVLLAGALCLGLIFLTVALNGHNIGRGIGLFWLVFLVVLAVGSCAARAVSLCSVLSWITHCGGELGDSRVRWCSGLSSLLPAFR